MGCELQRVIISMMYCVSLLSIIMIITRRAICMNSNKTRRSRHAKSETETAEKLDTIRP